MKVVRRVTTILAVVMLVGGAYAVTPFLTLWQIREALRTGDVSTLERKVDWPAVRQSLKQSNGEVRRTIADYSAAGTELKPGLWQRVKDAAAPMFTAPLIDRYVTADGAPRLYAWRQTWRQSVRPTIGLSEPPSLLAGTPLADTGLDRALSVARRVRRAAFASPTRIEIELRDRYRDDRRWKSVLQLEGWNWRLTEVHIQRDATARPPGN